jgi:hypothetical protein
MSGGKISGNTAGGGGGVSFQKDGKFTISGGEISGNESAGNVGGGISTGDNAAILMKGGRISGNTAKSSGGGIEVFKRAFTMEGGEISGNTSTDGDGGGVFLDNFDTTKFKMTGGVIYGSGAGDLSNKVVAADKTGAALYKGPNAQILETADVTDTTELTIDKRSNS